MRDMRLFAACLASASLMAADAPLTGGPDGLHRAGAASALTTGMDASWIVPDRARGLLHVIGGGRAPVLVTLRPDGSELGRATLPGTHACAGTLLHGGRVLVAVSYGGGAAAAVALDETGTPSVSAVWTASWMSGIHPKRQDAPHLHDAVSAPESPGIVLVPDLGADRVHVLRVSADGSSIVPADPPFTACAPGSGPRHLAFATVTAGRHDGYLIGELDLSLTRCTWDGTRLSTHERTMLVDTAEPAASAAEIIVHPSGRSVYATVRGPDLLVAFDRDPSSGALTLRERRQAGGRTPRHAAVDAAGTTLWVAHQGSSSVRAFTLDPADGAIIGEGPTLPAPRPACVLPP